MQLLVAVTGAIVIALVLNDGAIAVPVAVIAVIGCVLLLLRVISDRTRIAELRRVAHTYADGDFTSRASLSGDDSLAGLGHELNGLGERLASASGNLEAQRRLLDGALGSLAEGVACIDSLDHVIYANPAWRRLATDGSGVIGNAFYEQVPAAALSSAIAAMRTAAAGAQPVDGITFEHRGRHLRAAVARADEGVLVAVLHDITELLRLEGARREFVASVSHELKTPLTAIAGFTETLLDGALDDPAAARSFVERIARHADRLTVLVRDVLTLSRLEQGASAVHPEPIDLTELGTELRDEHLAAATEKKVAIVLDAPAQLDAHLDRELLHQLLGNLISNAVRYNRPEGTVWIRLAADGDDRLRLAVQDTGIGIPPEHQQRVFERFHRVDAHRSRQSGGTGLGLAIVKQLVELLGGTIALDSNSGGSVFTVLLPRRDGRNQT